MNATKSVGGMLYQVVDWNTTYENNRTREVKNTKWTPIPNRFDGDRISELIERGGSTAYGCWCALVHVAGRCDPKGRLVRRDGRPHDPASVSRITKLPSDDLQDTFNLALDIGLLEAINGSQDTASKRQAPAAPSQVIALAPQESVLHNKTEHNKTEHNTTEAPQETAASVVVSDIDLVVRELQEAAGLNAGTVRAIHDQVGLTLPRVHEVLAEAKRRASKGKLRDLSGWVRQALLEQWTFEEEVPGPEALRDIRWIQHKAKEQQERKQEDRQTLEDSQAFKDRLVAMPVADQLALRDEAMDALPPIVRDRVGPDADLIENHFLRAAAFVILERRNAQGDALF